MIANDVARVRVPPVEAALHRPIHKDKPINCTAVGYSVCNNDVAKQCWQSMHLECLNSGLGNGGPHVCQRPFD